MGTRRRVALSPDLVAHSRWFKFIRFYLDKTMKLCRLNAAGEDDGFGPSVASAQLPAWSHLVQIFYFYFSLKLLVSLVLQHSYSLIKYKLEVCKQQRQQLATRFKCQLEQELELAVERINLVGNPFYEMGFGAEVLFAIILFVVFLGYAQTRVYVAARGPVKFGALQMLLDPERERRQTLEGETQRQVNIFLGSSGNFWLARRMPTLASFEAANRCGQSPGRTRRRRRRTASLLSINQFKELPQLASRELEQAHERTVVAVSDLIARGELVPLNRRPEWTLCAAKIFSTMIVLFEASSTWLISVVMLVLPWSGTLRFKPHNAPRDLIFHVEFFLFCLLGIQAVGSNLLIIIVNGLDQADFVRQLRRMIFGLTCDVCRHRDNHHHLTAEVYATATCLLNRRLMRLLILYKLYRAQLRSTQPVIGFMAAHSSLLMLVLPVMGRLYVAHLAREVRLTLLAGALFIIFTCDLLVLPACYLNARCLDMFKSLCLLLAHLDSVRIERVQEQQVVAYDEHTVWLLRRELNMPEITVRHFACDAHFMRLTYSNFLGIHFWCSLLLAPLLLRDTARLSASGNLLTDSFRLF